MRLTRADLLPRTYSSAPRIGALMMMVAAALAALNVSLSPPAAAANLSVAVLVPVLLAVFAGVLSRRVDRPAASRIWLAAPVLGSVALAALNVATQDASAAAQVFVCYPVLFAASQLRPGGAAVATAAAVLGEAVTVFSLEPFAKAAPDFIYVTVVLVAMAVLLATSGLRHDRLIAQLAQQAAVDPLTGLVTRRVLDDAATCALSHTLAADGLSLILLDVDRFKTVNDTFGHPAGDAALRHTADIMRTHVRPDAVLSRMGGDELAVLLPGCSFEVAHDRAQHLARLVRETPLTLPDGRHVPLTVSAGVAHAPGHATTLAQLYHAADQALYAAKRAGRDRVAKPEDLVTLPG